jgi:hypothetical protein
MSTIITPSEEQINIVVNDEKISINVESGDVIVNVTENIVEVSTVNGGYPLPTTVYSVFGRTGNIIAVDGDYDLGELGDVTLVSSTNGDVLTYDGTKWINKAVTGTGTVTSVNMTVPVGLQVSGNPITVAGTLAVNFASGYSLPTTAKQTTWDTAYNDSIVSASVSGTTTKTLTLNQQDGGTITASWTDIDTNLVTSVNGYVGTVVLTTTDIAEGTRLYYTETRVSNNVDVAANTAARHSAVTIGTANGLSLASQVLSLALASASTTGALSSTDWVKFNTAYNDSIVSANVSGTTTKTLTLTQQDAGTITASWTDLAASGTVTSVAITESGDSLNITGSPITTSGTINIGFNGTNLQYVNGAGNLTTFPILTGYVPYTGATANVDLGTFNLTADVITGSKGSFASNGGSDTFAINHSSGAGIALNITKGGNGEGLYINKTSGSGNAATIIGTLNATTLVKSGGTSSQFLKADGTVDSSAYIALTSLSGVSPLSYNNTTGAFSIAQATTSVNGYLSSTDWTTFNGKQAALNGTGFVKISGTTISYDNSTYVTSAYFSATNPLIYSLGNFSIDKATTTDDGYLSKFDFNTFNNKQAAGNYITALSGEATASGPGSAAVTLSTSAVTGKLLTGVNITGGSISATDSILVAFGKVQNQINGVLGGAIYQSVWNASTNSPTLTSGTGTKGYYYIVSVEGSTNLDGITDWKVGDWAIFNGTTWNKVDNTDAVSSVNGYTGAVSLTTANISEVTNLYYTEGRVSANTDVAANTAARHAAVTIGTANGLSLSTQALSLGLASTSATGALSSTDWNTFNLKQAALSGTGFVKISGSTISYDNSTYYLASNPNGYTTNVGTVTSVAALTIGTSGTDLSSTVATSTTTPVITLNVPTASAANRGALSSADWSTFNSKQGTITLTTTGTSGAATFSSNTLNIPNYAPDLSGYVTLATTQTISGAKTFSTVIKYSGTSQILDASSGTTGYLYQYLANTTGAAYFGLERSTGGGLFTGSSAYATVLGSTTATSLEFGTNGIIRATINSSGNLGLGVTPSAWFSTMKSITVKGSNGNGSSWYSGGSQDLVFFANGYYDAAAATPTRNGTGGTAQYRMNDAQHSWWTDATTTGAISLTQAMTLTAAGRLLIGTPTEATYMLDVNGTGRFSGALSGTSATFTSGLIVSNTADVYPEFKTSAADADAFLGFSNTGDGNNAWSIGRRNTGEFWISNYTGNFNSGTRTQPLVIASTGAATFSSSVTAAGIQTTSSESNTPSMASLSTYQMFFVGAYNGIRQNTAHELCFDVYNSGVPKEGLKIAQTGAITVTSSVTATSFFESSDSRLKTLIQDNYQTKGIASITPKLYTKNGKVELGYYAQDFVGVLDSAVSKGSDEMLSLSYREVHTAKIYALEQRIKELETK